MGWSTWAKKRTDRIAEHDIDCGRAIGARTIGVGTGPFTAAELESHEPWWAVDVLPEPPAFLARVLES